MVDIHNYELKYRQAVAQVEQSDLSPRNKELILGYRDACLVQGTCKHVRLIRVMGALLLFGRILRQDFDTLTKNDVQRLISALLARTPAYSAETLGTYRAIIKRFLTWVLSPDSFPRGEAPPAVGWLTAHVPRKDRRTLHRNDLLTPKEIESVMRIAHNTRDRALISTLWETGGRIAEIGNLQIKHVSKAPHGFHLELHGKTGHRTPLVVSSAPHLATWLAHHPFAKNHESPLWVHYQYRDTPDFLRYDTIRNLLINLFRRAGVTKHVHPHLFRHSRATYVIASGLMTESQAKRYFGWAPDTGMLANYTHLIDEDANNAILREHNLAPTKTPRQDAASICPRCTTINTPQAPFCTSCQAPLDAGLAFRQTDEQQQTTELALTIARILVERGLIDEAAEAIHKSRMGETLQRLARNT